MSLSDNCSPFSKRVIRSKTAVTDVFSPGLDQFQYGKVSLPQEILRQFFQHEEPAKEVVEAVVFQEEIWSRVLFSIMHPGLFRFSEEVYLVETVIFWFWKAHKGNLRIE